MHDFDTSAMYSPTVDGEPDWRRDENALFEASMATLRSFATSNPDTLVSAFGFDSEPCYGYALISIETPANSLRVAIEREVRETKSRYEYLAKDSAWKVAKDRMRRQAIDHADSTGYFEFSQLADVKFDDWESFSASDNYPVVENRPNLDFLEGHACLIFWRVIERLVDANAFNTLNLWSPFRIGFNFHDEPFMAVRILNRRTPDNG